MISSGLTPYVCTNCGFWQRHFAPPLQCPVCLDFRHTAPETGWEFWIAEHAAARITTHWQEDERGILRFYCDPPLGIGPSGYLIPLPDGNLLFENPAWYSDDALAEIARRGGVHWLAASHPHAYGALWQAQERFSPEATFIHTADLPWTSAFRVDHPYEEPLEIVPGATLIPVGGHFDGQSILYLRELRLLFAGDMVKYHADLPGGGISTHKAFNRRVPMSHAEIRCYRQAVAPLDFADVYTTFERAPAGGGTTASVLRLFDAQLAGPTLLWAGPVARGFCQSRRHCARGLPRVLRARARGGRALFRVHANGDGPLGPAAVECRAASARTGRFPTASATGRRSSRQTSAWGETIEW